MPLPMLLGTQLKMAGVAVLATLVIGGLAGGWWHIKKMTELKTKHTIEVNVLKAELWFREQSQAELSEKLLERDRTLADLRSTKKELDRKIEEVKSENEDIADYLESTVPERMQQLTHDTICTLLPDSCERNGTDGS